MPRRRLRAAQQRVGKFRLDYRVVGAARLQGLQEQAFERGVERYDLQLGFAREDLLHDRAAERDAHQRGELAGVLRARRRGRQRLR